MWRQRAISLNSRRLWNEASSSHWLRLSYASYSDSATLKSKAKPLQERKIIDRFKLHAKGGDGGNGSASVRRSRSDRYGKPDGGNGGKGGDVILQCSSSVWDFRGLRHRVNGGKGGKGLSKSMIGSRGEDQIVRVPMGTVIHLVEGELPSEIDEPQVSESSDPWEAPGALSSDPWDVPGALSSDSCESSTSQMNANETTETNSAVPSTQHRGNNNRRFGIRQSRKMSSAQSYSQATTDGLHSSPPDDDEAEENGNDSDNDYDDSTEMDHYMNKQEKIQYDVAELTEEGQQLLVARGGTGGLGSSSHGRAARIAEWRMKHDKGGHGEENNLSSRYVGLPGSEALMILELKTIADVGFVGMPNAGKSTLLGAISRAKPAVGDYAFTTLKPTIGQLNYNELSMSVADIPGLIKGAHLNRGLGHAFLRHVERTKVLAYVVDLAAALDERTGIPPWEQLRDLVTELEHYKEGLSSRPSLIVANKIDEDGAEGVCEELKRRVKGVPIFPVCAILEDGVPELKDGLKLLVGGSEAGCGLDLKNILVD